MTHKKTVLYSKIFYLQMLTTYSFVTQKIQIKNKKTKSSLLDNCMFGTLFNVLKIAQLHVYKMKNIKQTLHVKNC